MSHKNFHRESRIARDALNRVEAKESELKDVGARLLGNITVSPQIPRVWLSAIPAGALAASLCLYWILNREASREHVSTERECPAMFSSGWIDTEACPNASEVVLALGELEVAPGSRVRRAAERFEVLRGTVKFDIHKRGPDSAPIRVAVSDGEIVVIGTLFTVKQSLGGGSVELHEGTIRFVHRSGDAHVLQAGETYRWPQELAPVPKPREQKDAGGQSSRKSKLRPKRPAPAPRVLSPRSEAPAPDVAQVLRQMVRLRAQRRYQEAYDLLRSTSANPRVPGEQRAQLSLEAGLLLEGPLHRTDLACRHWKRHLDEFADRTTAGSVREKVARCER